MARTPLSIAMPPPSPWRTLSPSGRPPRRRSTDRVVLRHGVPPPDRAVVASGSEDRSVLTQQASAPDAVLPYGSDAEQVADVRFAADAVERPPLVVVHGGFWRPAFDRVQVRPMTEALAAAGWTTVTPEYRRVPGRPDLAVGDVHAAVRAIAEWPGCVNRRLLLVG